tara:strand:+ start:23037 stop:23966 length:930 start_codon:yes stop_codon:yes gene_type:complete
MRRIQKFLQASDLLRTQTKADSRTEKLKEGRHWGSALQRQRAALADAGVSIEYVTIRGIQMRIGRSQGQGRPLLVCNGIGANLELLLPMVASLKGRPVILFDLPGAGGSEDFVMLPRMKNYARIALRVLSHCQCKDVDVMGISWGGLLAQQLAIFAPNVVNKLILMATSSGFTMLPGRFNALRLMTTPRRYLSRNFMARHAHTLYGGELLNNPEAAKQHARLSRAPTGLSYAQQLLAAQFFTSLPWLWRVKCPALILAGDDDPLMRLFNGRVLERVLPNAKMRVLEGGGHLFAVMQAEKTAGYIDNFLQ